MKRIRKTDEPNEKDAKRKNAARKPWYRGDDVPGDNPGHGVYKTKAGPKIRN